MFAPRVMFRSLMPVALSVFGALGVAGLVHPLDAQVFKGQDTNAPVTIDAGSASLQDRADRVVMTGGVSVTQAGLNLRSARMTIAYSPGSKVQINRIDATGGVTVTRGNQRATGISAIYDLDRRLITMIGNVQLNDGANRLSGGRVVINLATGQSTIDGSGGAGSGPDPANGFASHGGRVTGTFTVPQHGDPSS